MTLLICEGANLRVSEIFYRLVAQAVLLFVSEIRLLLAAIERKVEVTHMGFLRHIRGNRARRIVY